jgi:hypothetical protein
MALKLEEKGAGVFLKVRVSIRLEHMNDRTLGEFVLLKGSACL